jgi:hypothetical protein
MGADLGAVADPDARDGQLGRKQAQPIVAVEAGRTSDVGTEPI